MPSLNTVESFVTMVEAGQGIRAIINFYAEHVSVQENEAAPRVGKQTILKHEHAAQASVSSLKATCVRPILVSGDIAVVRWIFEYTSKAGRLVRFEELTYQRWEDELIVEERFFYDPAQFHGGAA